VIRPLFKRRVLPGFGLTMGVTLFYASLVIVLPLFAMIQKTTEIEWSEFVAILTSARSLAALRVTLTGAAIATLFNAVFGLLLAWVIVRYRFPGRRLLDAVIDLPFALPTAVAGLALTTLFAANGWIGQFIEPLGIKIAYAPPGIALAMAFTSIPFVVRSVQPVLEDLDETLEEAAHTLGASAATTFWRLIFPTILPAFLAGCALAFARGLGEFGAVVFISGNLPLKTEIVALLILIRLDEFNYEAAAVLASILLAISFVLLFVTNAFQAWQLRYVGR
jgi:sulfate transport system permease protein